jgi:hypothetical protein
MQKRSEDQNHEWRVIRPGTPLILRLNVEPPASLLDFRNKIAAEAACPNI